MDRIDSICRVFRAALSFIPVHFCPFPSTPVHPSPVADLFGVFPSFCAGECLVPCGAARGALAGGEGGGEAALLGPLVGDFIGGLPEADGESGEVGGAEGGCFDDPGPGDGESEQVGLELHEQVVCGGSAVHAQLRGVGAGVGGHGVEHVGDLEGDALQGGACDVRGGGAAGDAGDDAAGVGVPVGRAEPGEGGHEADAAGVGHGGGEGLDFGGAAHDAEPVAEPLDDGPGDEDAALEGVFEFSAAPPGDGGEEVVP